MKAGVLPTVSRLSDVATWVLTALRDCCAAAGYDDELVMSMSRLAAGAGGNEYLPVVQHVLRRRGDRAGTLARLLAYRDTLDVADVQELLGEAVVAALLDARLLECTERGICSNFHLRPLEGVWLLADDPSGG